MESVANPDIPCPAVQPDANRAPNIIITPAKTNVQLGISTASSSTGLPLVLLDLDADIYLSEMDANPPMAIPVTTPIFHRSGVLKYPIK